MAILEDLADQLAQEAIKASERLGDDLLIDEMSKAIGASSPTTQEAFVTAVHIRQALGRGRGVMARKRTADAASVPNGSEDI